MQIKHVLSALMLIAILASPMPVETDSLAAGTPAPVLATGLISNDLFLFAPDVLSFDIQSFLDSQPGPLKTYQEQVNGEPWTATEIIRFNAIYFGINPQVLLIMLEATENTITQSDSLVLTRSSADTPGMTGFYAHVNRLANSALSAYDAHRYGLAGAKIILQDGSSAEVLAGSSGTYAIQSLLAESLPHDRWQAWTQGSAAKFSAIFTEWFGSPLATSTTTVMPDALPGDYGLPFPVGETWYYTGGPHHYCGWGYQSCTNPQAGGRPWSSIDLGTPESVACPGGGYLANRWVVSAKSGTVVQSSQGLVVIDHGDGWRTYYSHIATQDRHDLGYVGQGDAIGHPSCEVEPGGSTTGSIHLHFAVWHAGDGFVNIAGSALSGWAIGESTFYNGTISRDGNTRYASVGRQAGYNDVVSYSSQGIALNLTVKLENPQRLSNFNHSNQIAVVLLRPNTNQIVFGPRTVNSDANGFSGGLNVSGIPPGSYDICAKARHYLGQCARNVSVIPGNTISVDLSNGGARPAWLGDIDIYGEDNQENMLDFERIRAACFTQGLCGRPYPEFDMNRDGNFDTQDTSLVLARVGLDLRGEGYFGKPFPVAAASSEPEVLAPTSTGTLRLEPAIPNFIMAGEERSQSIVLDTSGASVSGVDVMLYYDPEVVQILDEDSGTSGVQVQNAGVFPIVTRNRVDSANGIIWFSARKSGTSDQFNGTATVANFRVRILWGTPNDSYTRIIPMVVAGDSTDSNSAQYGTARDIIGSGIPNSFITTGVPRHLPGISLAPSSNSVLGGNAINAVAQINDTSNQIDCVRFTLLPDTGNSVSQEDCDRTDGWGATLEISHIPDQAGATLAATVRLRATQLEYTAQSVNLTLDRTPPQLDAVTFTPNIPSPGQKVVVEVRVRDNLGPNVHLELWANKATDGSDRGDWVRADWGDFLRPNGSQIQLQWDTNGFAAGSHLVSITMRDDAENWNAWNTMRTLGGTSNPSTVYLPVVGREMRGSVPCSLGAEGVILYEHADYGGKCLALTTDDPDFNLDNFNDMASSIRFVGSYGTGWEAVAYEHSYYGGVSSVFQGDDPNFGDDTIGHDRVSSIQIHRSGPSAYWRLDEGSGLTANDATGNGNTGTLVNGPTWSTGQINGALSFDGADDFVRINRSVLDTSKDYTVAAWVMLREVQSFKTAVSQEGAEISGFYLQTSWDGRFTFGAHVADLSSADARRVIAPWTPQANQWYHLAGIHDSVHDQIKLYVNGVLIGTEPYGAGWNATGNTLIGRAKHGGNPADFWPGKIDDVRLFDHVLSDSDVLTLYKQAPGNWITILNEDFEGSFPGAWQVSSDDGQYYWGKRSCLAYAGAYSGWAVGGGPQGSALGCDGSYPNNATIGMWYGPFSLTGVTAAEIRFKLWLNTEWNGDVHDSFCVWASRDGVGYGGVCHWGYSGGWSDQSLDLTGLAGEPNVWIAFGFYSNGSVNQSVGAYIDDIVVRKCIEGSCPPSSAQADSVNTLFSAPAQRKLEH